MAAQTVIMTTGWILMMVSWFIRDTNDKRLMWKIALSALATGLFIAGAIHSLMK